MALLQAITGFAHLLRGFRNCDLRPRVEALLGRPYGAAQMTYDLRRLRLKGLIHRIPQTHRYTATTDGPNVAFFYCQVYLPILRPQWNALMPDNDQLPRSLRRALDQLDAEIEKLGGDPCCLKNLLQLLRCHPYKMSSAFGGLTALGHA
jgi:hypothetical protein